MGNIIKLNDAQFDSLECEVVNSNAENFCGYLLDDSGKASNYVSQLGDCGDYSARYELSALSHEISSLGQGITMEQARYVGMGVVFQTFHDLIHYNDEEFAGHVDTVYSEATKGKSIEDMQGTVETYFEGRAVGDVLALLGSYDGLDPEAVFAYLQALAKLGEYDGMTLADVEADLEKYSNEPWAIELLKILNDEYFVIGKNPHEIVITALEEPQADALAKKVLMKILESKKVVMNPSEIAALESQLVKLNEQIAKKTEWLYAHGYNRSYKQFDKVRKLEKQADEIVKKMNEDGAKVTKVSKFFKALPWLLLVVDCAYEGYEGAYVNGLDWDKVWGDILSDAAIPGLLAMGTGALAEYLVGVIAGSSLGGPWGTVIGIVAAAFITIAYYAADINEFVDDKINDFNDWWEMTFDWDIPPEFRICPETGPHPTPAPPAPTPTPPPTPTPKPSYNPDSTQRPQPCPTPMPSGN